MDRLRRHEYDQRKKSAAPLSAEEKAKRLQEMQAASLALNEQRKDRSGFTAAERTDDKETESRSGQN